MSATEELRRIFDERGVEWYEAGGVTFFGASVYGTRYAASEPECGITLDPLTPEQAIAVTLPHAASTHAALLQESKARMALQREYNNQIKRIQNQRKQLREMQAALERKTCHMVLRHDYTVYGEAPDIWWECDGCGCTLPNPLDMSEIHYCPSCGRRMIQ